MKRSWKVRRQLQECPDGQQRWDRAFQHVLRWAQPSDSETTLRADIGFDVGKEGDDESRDLRTCFDHAAGSDTVH
jgi:hypothetical protein